MDKNKLETLLNLGESYKNARKQEDELKELRRQILKLEMDIQNNYDKTKTKKAIELYEQLSDIITKITFLEEEINNIKTNYCNQQGHKNLNNFAECRCVLCGQKWHSDEFIGNFSYIDKSIITIDCYNSTQYSRYGLSIKSIEEQLIELYRDYAIIITLLKSVYGIFGNECKQSSNDIKVIERNDGYFLSEPEYSKIDNSDKLHYIDLSNSEEENLQQIREIHKYIISSGDIEKDIKYLQEEYHVKQKKKIPTMR